MSYTLCIASKSVFLTRSPCFPRSFEANEDVIRKGEEGTCLYLLYEGAAEAEIDGTVTEEAEGTMDGGA